MKTKHTKGEWAIEPMFNHSINITAGKRGFVLASVTGDSVAHFVGNTEEAKANAKLIAAAPELLEALSGFIYSVEHEGVISGKVVDAVRNAREIIKKAIES